MPVRVAVDAMGGDHAPGVVVEGVLEAVAEAGDRVTVLLVGREAEVRAEIEAQGGVEGDHLRVVDAPEAIGMGESATEALRKKPDSSIHRGVGAVKAGRADAFASAGNTGAVMAAALFGLGRLPGVLRPALPGYLPTPTGTCVLLDVGANVEVRPEHLVQFARMGAVFGEFFLDKEAPTVGLVNVGEEPGKGTDTVKEVHQALRALGDRGAIHFVGNVEGPRHPPPRRRRSACATGSWATSSSSWPSRSRRSSRRWSAPRSGARGSTATAPRPWAASSRGCSRRSTTRRTGASRCSGSTGPSSSAHGGSTARAVRPDGALGGPARRAGT